MNTGYKTPYIAKRLFDEGIRPVMPYKRPQTKKGYFLKHDYVYDAYYDCYLCPQGERLTYRTTTRDGYRQYVSSPDTCQHCPVLNQCTQNQHHIKQVHRHIWQDYLDEAEHLRHAQINKAIYHQRKETIERVFADMKEKHGMRWTTLHFGLFYLIYSKKSF